MAAKLYTLHSEALPADAEVVAFRGQESLSEPYRFEIGFITSDPTFLEDDALLARATLTFELGALAQPYRYHGVLSSVELLHTFKGKSLYRAVLVPKLWTLELARHSNVWTDAPIPSVLADVLEWSGLESDEFSLQLEQSYPSREFIAQYRESNLDFLHRWMERLGLFYYFEQGEKKERVVIVDGPQYDALHGPGVVKYRPLSEGDSMALEAFEWVRSRSRAVPHEVALHDYDYLKPTLEVRGLSKLGKAKRGTMSRFAEDHFATPTEGEALARIRMQSLEAQQRVLEARGRVFHLQAGRLFSLDDHPRGELNRKYLAVSISHEGNQAADLPEVMSALGIELDKEYACEVRAIASDLTYRTPIDRTPWPRISSYESAVVCGEAESPYAQLDEQGRYKVRVMFDESELGDGKASAWVRQQQPYGGSTEGFHFPLLKGTEVTLIFLGGDPDRPVIAGVVPNAKTPSPVVAKNHTQNVIQTAHENLIRLEDKLGEQSMYMYCPIETTSLYLGVLKDGFNALLSTHGHGLFTFGGKQVVEVCGTLTEKVIGDVANHYLSNYAMNVTGDSAVEMFGTKSLHVVGDTQYDFDGLWKTTVLGDQLTEVSGLSQLHVVGDAKETYNANILVDVAGDLTETVSGNVTKTINGNESVKVLGATDRAVSGDVIENFSASYGQTVVGTTLKKFLSVSASFNGGATSETFVGVRNSNQVGAKIELFAGLKFEAALGLKLKFAAGAKLEFDGSVDLRNRPIKIDKTMVNIENHLVSVDIATVKLESAALTIFF